MPNLRAITSCQMDECQSEVSYELRDLRIFADRPICFDCFTDGPFDERWDDLPPVLAIDYEGLEGLQGFLGDLFSLWAQHDCGDIDGCDFQDMLHKHGLTTRREMTQEECDEEWAQEWGYEPGDLCYMYSPTMLTLIRRGS